MVAQAPLGEIQILCLPSFNRLNSLWLIDRSIEVDLVNSIKRFFLVLALLTVATFGMLYLFDRLIAVPAGLSMLLDQSARTVILLISGSIILLFVRRSKPLISRRVGVHPATVFQLFVVLTVVLGMIFGIFGILNVELGTLLIGGSVVSIVIGLVISTFVGNILAGTMVFMTNPFRVGDTVLVNNIPGEVTEITSIVTRITNDIGGEIVIPNTAIAQGGVIVTRFPSSEAVSRNRLPYAVGDRVYTTYISGEGVVKELTLFHTKILLDSGKELTFLNSSVLTGSVAIAKVS